MKIYLLRHFESEKNIRNQLSGTDEEKLTLKGIQECRKFAQIFAKFCDAQSINLTSIESANSERAKETAHIIAGTLLIDRIIFHSELTSTKAGNIAGKSMDEIKKQDPFFAKYYKLYRAGLLNSYFFDENWKDERKENKKEFELRVMECINNIIMKNDKNNAILIVAHRASITAMLINAARKMKIYPDDFYGHVELSIGGLSCISVENNTWEIQFVNLTKEELENENHSIFNKS